MSDATQDRLPLPGWEELSEHYWTLPGTSAEVCAEYDVERCKRDPDRRWEWSVHPHDYYYADSLVAAKLAAEDVLMHGLRELAAVLGLKVVDGNTPIPSPAVREALALVSRVLADPEADYAYLEAIESLREAIAAEMDGAA